MLMFNINYDKYYNKSGKWEINSVTRVVRWVGLLSGARNFEFSSKVLERGFSVCLK